MHCMSIWMSGQHEEISSIWLNSHFRLSFQGTREVEGIALELGHNNAERVSAEAFAPMKRLKLLKLDNVQIDGEYRHISKDLTWLYWHHFSLNFIPDDFCLKQVVAIDMQHSHLVEVWKNSTVLSLLRMFFSTICSGLSKCCLSYFTPLICSCGSTVPRKSKDP